MSSGWDYNLCSYCGGKKRKPASACRACYWKNRIESGPARFERKIKKTNSCWIWAGTVNNVWGYGQFVCGKKQWRAHRYSWHLNRGPIPDGMEVCHSCDVRLCVNPDHLWLGTQLDNMRDMAKKGRSLNGQRNPMSKVSDSDVVEIRRLSATGVRQQDLADRFGLCQPHISGIINNKRRKH